MSPATPDAEPLRAVIVGGGIAALEAVLALHDLAGARVAVTLVAPASDFALRSLTVAEPFGLGPIGALDLAEVMAEHGGRFVQAAVEHVDATRHVVRGDRLDELPYDALIVATGAQPVRALAADVTFDGSGSSGLGTVTQALDAGLARSVAFVVPGGCTWPLPLYELALLTAHGARKDPGVELHFITPEPTPLSVLGPEGSADVARRLTAARVAFHGGVEARLSGVRQLEIGTPMPLVVDRVVALPVLQARKVAGLPGDEHGFIPVDELSRVQGLDRVWAAGDGTDQPIKQGGLACQQADLIAEQIAAMAGAPVTVAPRALVIRVRLFDGADEAYLRRTVGQTHGEASATPLWSSAVKVVGTYLAPYLQTRDLAQPRPFAAP